MIQYAPEPESRPRRLTMAARACLEKLYRLRGRLVFRPLEWRGWEIRRPRDNLIFWYPESAGNELIARGLVEPADGTITQDGIDEIRGNAK